MNITPGLIYWLSRLDEVNATASCLSLIAILVIIVCGIVYAIARTEDEDDTANGVKSVIKKTIPILFISVCIDIFVPSSKEMAATIVIPKIANSEQIQNIGDGIYNLAFEWMEELSPKNGKNK